MDTRYWGPSGWRLLHLISFSQVPKRADVCAFFNTLAFVLPCKYCRYSFSENISKDPIEANDSIPRWLWRMHNKVNAKLRGQRLCRSADPSFQSVQRIYEERLESGCTRTIFEGWEFLFSVAEAHPLSRQGRSSVPIQGHPVEVTTDLEKNKWNLLTPDERMVYYNRFWELLPAVLPFKEWSAIWRAGIPGTRKELLKHLWGTRCDMEAKLELLNSTSYNSLCKELKHYRSGCATSLRGKTCRKKRGTK
jgi:hypothetical protein